MTLNLTQIIRAAKRTDTVITPRLNDWLMAHGDEAVPDDIAAKVFEQMTTPPRDRSASFSSSSAGMCKRRQVLGYLGIAEAGAIDPKLQNIFNDGKWRHLRWQTMLLSAGLIDSMEEPLFWRRMRSRGTMDGRGIVPDDHVRPSWRDKEFGFELKGVGAYIYPKVMKDEEIKAEHKRQVHRYFLMSALDLFIVIYENKGTNEWYEWVVEPEDELIEEQRQELIDLNDSVDAEELPPMLKQCRAQVGPVFNECPYGGKGGPCIRSGTWPNLRK